MAAKPKTIMRSVVVQIPEPEMLRIVKRAAEAGLSVHEYVARIVVNAGSPEN